MSSVTDEHLNDSSGKRRDYQALKEELGDTVAQGAVLEYELRRRLRIPRARGYPPRVFISYHRQTPGHINWCRRLAESLEQSGYRVFLDDLVLTGEATTEEISVFVARLALSDVAVLVLTDEYAPQPADSKSLTQMRYWLYEEWSRINTLRDWGLLEIVTVWRSGTFPGEHGTHPGPVVQINNSLDAVIDATDDERGLQQVLRFFGRYQGPRYDGPDLRILADSAAAVVTASLEKRVGAASAYLDRIREFSDTEEYKLALAYWIANFQDREDGARRALGILDCKPGIPTSFLIAELLWLIDFDTLALSLFARIADSSSLWRHRARFTMADIHSRLGAFSSAVNNLNWTLQPNALELGGYWSQFAEETKADLAQQLIRMQEAAANQLATAAAAARDFGIHAGSAQEIWPTPSRRCEFCSATFPATGYACILCAGMQRFRFWRCPYCMQEDTCAELANIVLCPVCKLFRNNHGTVAVHFAKRRTGREFSVLNSDFEGAMMAGGPIRGQSPVKEN